MGLLVESTHMVLTLEKPSSTKRIIPEETSEFILASRDLFHAPAEAMYIPFWLASAWSLTSTLSPFKRET
jgi:hypothetical protein